VRTHEAGWGNGMSAARRSLRHNQMPRPRSMSEMPRMRRTAKRTGGAARLACFSRFRAKRQAARQARRAIGEEGCPAHKQWPCHVPMTQYADACHRGKWALFLQPLPPAARLGPRRVANCRHAPPHVAAKTQHAARSTKCARQVKPGQPGNRRPANVLTPVYATAGRRDCPARLRVVVCRVFAKSASGLDAPVFRRLLRKLLWPCAGSE
jgi:hypothetical protein